MGWGRILEASPPSKDCQECATAISSKKNDTKSPPFTRQIFLSKPSQTGLEEPAAPGKPEQSESPRLDGQEEQAGEGMAGSARGPGGDKGAEAGGFFRSPGRKISSSPGRMCACPDRFPEKIDLAPAFCYCKKVPQERLGTCVLTVEA